MSTVTHTYNDCVVIVMKLHYYYYCHQDRHMGWGNVVVNIIIIVRIVVAIAMNADCVTSIWRAMVQ